MHANMMVFLCSLFATFKDCTSSAIFSYVGSKSDTSHDIPDETRKEVENIYIQSFISDIPRDDPICALTAGRKKALCERIFQISHYRSSGIYLNKVALHLARLPCEEKLLTFKYRSDFLDKSVEQIMYPCYGRHESVRTSIIEDTYYDTVYVSGGPDLNSVTVYIYEYDATSDWYIVYDYIHNVNVSELRDMFITVKEVTAELKLNKNIMSTVNYRELEIIFLREQDYHKTDPICDLEYERKISLCKIVFSSRTYKEGFHITLNKAAVYVLDMECKKKPVSIDHPKYHIVEQNMYPCYGRKDTSTEFLFSDKFLKRFYVSRGPRKNSVFMYAAKIVDHEEQFRLVDLFENIHTRDLIPTEITDEELVKESPSTYLEVQELIEMEESSVDRTGVVQRPGSEFEKNVSGSRIQRSQERTDEGERAFSNITESTEEQEKTDFQKPDVNKPKSEEVTEMGKELLLESSAYAAQIGPHVMKRLKAKKRETDEAPNTYNFEASASSHRLRKKLEQRKLMKKGKLTVEEQNLEEEVEKLIKEMEESLRMKGTNVKRPEKDKIPEQTEDEVKESDEKDSVRRKRKKTKKKKTIKIAKE